jgi:spore coat polysaccharide biosynthesis predicted glycosyltransferase SpsG
MGHVVRCHALAECLRERGASVCFVTAPGAAETWLRGRGVAVEALAVEAGTPEDAAALKRTASPHGTDVIVTDGYAFRTEYLASLAAIGMPLVSIDDLAAWPFPSALVVNGGLGAEHFDYDTPAGAVVLKGPQFLLLRSAFRAREGIGPRSFPPIARRVLACFGGADPLDWTRLVLEVWARTPGRPGLDLVAGPAYRDLDALRERAAPLGAIVHHDLEAVELAALMAQSDLAIASCGMVAGELLALGVPALFGVASEDQSGNADTVRTTGSGRVVEPFDTDALGKALVELVADPRAREALSRAGTALVDGRGAERVADAILALGTAA